MISLFTEKMTDVYGNEWESQTRDRNQAAVRPRPSVNLKKKRKRQNRPSHSCAEQAWPLSGLSMSRTHARSLFADSGLGFVIECTYGHRANRQLYQGAACSGAPSHLFSSLIIHHESLITSC